MPSTRFLLLMGPTGCGKTSVVRILEQLDARFKYIRPYTTRALREGETDKIFVTASEMDSLWKKDKLIVINRLYGVKYGTPRDPIESAFELGDFPLIDWPIQRLDVMEKAFPNKLYRVYLKPPSREELVRRLSQRIDYEDRLEVATKELDALEQGQYDSKIDALFVSETDTLREVAVKVFNTYLNIIEKEYPCPVNPSGSDL